MSVWSGRSSSTTDRCGQAVQTPTPLRANAAQSRYTVRLWSGPNSMLAARYAECAGPPPTGWLALYNRAFDARPSCMASAFSCFVHSSVNRANFPHPAPTIAVLHIHDLGLGPVNVIGNVGYLLVQLIEGVAYNPPKVGRSISKACRHCGQVAVRCP
jgi:hypothetical protein